MDLGRPKVIARSISVALDAVALLGWSGVVVGLGAYSFFLVTAGIVLSIVVTLVKNL